LCGSETAQNNNLPAQVIIICRFLFSPRLSTVMPKTFCARLSYGQLPFLHRPQQYKAISTVTSVALTGKVWQVARAAVAFIAYFEEDYDAAKFEADYDMNRILSHLDYYIMQQLLTR